MEESCIFISTRGIVRSCDQQPLWKEWNNPYPDFITDIDLSLGYTQTIYIKTDHLNLFSQICDKIKNNFILVTGCSDYIIPNDFDSVSSIILNCKKCVKWFATNCIPFHPKLIPIPIGIDYHTLYYNGKILPKTQEVDILEIKNSLIPLLETKPFAVTNFQHAMSPNILRRHVVRKDAYNKLINKDCVIWLELQERCDFWRSCNDNMFVICPFGNGPDTHRAWEVLILGRVPIVHKFPMNSIFNDLPVVEVEDWDIVTSEFLKSQYDLIIERFKRGEYNMEKITLNYWANFIKNS